MNKLSRFDLFSLGLLVFISIISVIRFNYLPQFIDAYYHLSVANGFIKSGGWVGWNWWDFAPLGRPHLYPPVYHFILVFLQKIGISGLNSLRITEVLITPLFFFFTWYTARKLVNDRFSFFTLLTLSSFFSFYSAVSANIPASLAIIFGLLTWLFIKKKKFISAVLFFALSFYTHAAIPWVFLFSLLFLVLFNKEYAKPALRVILVSLLLALPFLYHQFRYLNYIKLQVLGESDFIHFSVFIILFGLLSLLLHAKNRDFYILLFLGYLLGSLLVFLKYPYRFFSAQGIIGLVFFSSLFLEKIFKFNYKKIALLSIVTIYLFFLHTTIDLDRGKPRFILFNSTYHNILWGKVGNLFEFSSFFFPQLYYPILEVVKENSSSTDIISSNSSIFSQILSALAERPSANSMLWEVRPKERFNYYKYAKLIVWLSPFIDERRILLKDTRLKCIYAKGGSFIFLNLDYKPSLTIIRSRVNFLSILLIFFLLFALFLKDNLKRLC